MDAEYKRQIATLERIISELEQRCKAAGKVSQGMLISATTMITFLKDLDDARKSRDELTQDRSTLQARVKGFEDKESSLRQSVADALSNAGILCGRHALNCLLTSFDA